MSYHTIYLILNRPFLLKISLLSLKGEYLELEQIKTTYLILVYPPILPYITITLLDTRNPCPIFIKEINLSTLLRYCKRESGLLLMKDIIPNDVMCQYLQSDLNLTIFDKECSAVAVLPLFARKYVFKCQVIPSRHNLEMEY